MTVDGGRGTPAAETVDEWHAESEEVEADAGVAGAEERRRAHRLGPGHRGGTGKTRTAMQHGSPPVFAVARRTAAHPAATRPRR